MTSEKRVDPSSQRPRVAIVVNAVRGNMVRRGHELARHMRGLDITVLPGANHWARKRFVAVDLVYVIDPGRRGLPAAFVARLSGRPVVVEMGDPQGDLYQAEGRGRASILAGRAIDRVATRRATAVVVRGRGLARVLDIRVPWIEIPDGVDPELFRPGLESRVRDELGIPEDALVVGLVGSLSWAPGAGIGYGWDIIEALALTGGPVWGLLVGHGTGVARLRERARELRVGDRLVLAGAVPHRIVPQYIGAMDVCISTQSDDAIGRSRTTAKLPEYLACDRFVLATAVGGAAEVLPPEMLLPYEGQRDDQHPARLAQRLTQLAARQPELRRGVGTRAIALERYAYSVLADRLSSFLTEMLSGRNGRSG
jgi:glycosyltransferase involved in cell wall biosynthesis